MTSRSYVGFDDQIDPAELEGRCADAHVDHRGRRLKIHGRPLEADGVFYRLTGVLDGEGYPALQKALEADLAAGRRRIFIDAAAMDYISSAGVGTLVTMGKRSREAGGGLVVLRSSPSVREVFQVLGMWGGG